MFCAIFSTTPPFKEPEGIRLELRWVLSWALLILSVAGCPGVVAQLHFLEAPSISSLSLLFGIQLPCEQVRGGRCTSKHWEKLILLGNFPQWHAAKALAKEQGTVQL